MNNSSPLYKCDVTRGFSTVLLHDVDYGVYCILDIKVDLISLFGPNVLFKMSLPPATKDISAHPAKSSVIDPVNKTVKNADIDRKVRICAHLWGRSSPKERSASIIRRHRGLQEWKASLQCPNRRNSAIRHRPPSGRHERHIARGQKAHSRYA